MKRRRDEIDRSIARYLSQLESADRQDKAGGVPVAEAKITRLTEKVAILHEELERLQVLETEILEMDDKQISLTDPDARSSCRRHASSMIATSGRDTGIVGYNVQSAVDTEHHLIVTHEVTNIGTGRGQLFNMAKQARDALKAETIEVFADKGYFKSEEIAACEDSGISVYVPKPATSNARARGRFYKGDFIYDKTDDIYVCPAGQRLTYRMTGDEDGRKIRTYWTNTCEACPLKSDCTTGKQRRIT